MNVPRAASHAANRIHRGEVLAVCSHAAGSGGCRPVGGGRRPRGWFLLLLLAGGMVGGGEEPAGAADERRTRNVFLITTDGLRWEEVFRGAEESLINKQFGNVSDTNALRARFWRSTPGERREALFPFLWGTVAKRGQLWGNRDRGSEVRVSNGLNFSYPGYSELLTGGVDPRIDSNDKLLNTNTNVFEWLNGRPGFRGRVAAAVNWDVLPWVLNAPRAGFPVWSGFEVPAETVRMEVPEALTDLVEHGRTIWSGVLFASTVAALVGEDFKRAMPSAAPVVPGLAVGWLPGEDRRAEGDSR